MTERYSQEDFVNAWREVAQSPAGKIVYLHLQRMRLGIAQSGIKGGALRHFEGRRSLAADLMAYMAEGIEHSDGRDPTERPVVIAVGQPVAVGRRQSVRDWLAGQPAEHPERNPEPAKPAGGAP